MKKFLIFTVLLLASLGSVIPVSSGRTDSQRGHTETKTQTYHTY